MPMTVANQQIDHANLILERLRALDDAVAGGRAFCALNKDLHDRDISIVRDPHVTTITMVRAAILRAALGVAMACLDQADPRGNRASIGQILSMFDDDDLAVFHPSPGPARNEAAAKLAEARADYAAVLASPEFRAGRQLRNDSVSHLLIARGRTPNVEYEAIYQLHENVERLVLTLFGIVGGRPPEFPEHRARLDEHAAIFWDTYFVGMRDR